MRSFLVRPLALGSSSWAASNDDTEPGELDRSLVPATPSSFSPLSNVSPGDCMACMSVPFSAPQDETKPQENKNRAKMGEKQSGNKCGSECCSTSRVHHTPFCCTSATFSMQHRDKNFWNQHCLPRRPRVCCILFLPCTDHVSFQPPQASKTSFESVRHIARKARYEPLMAVALDQLHPSMTRVAMFRRCNILLHAKHVGGAAQPVLQCMYGKGR